MQCIQDGKNYNNSIHFRYLHQSVYQYEPSDEHATIIHHAPGRVLSSLGRSLVE
jgi:hypothetical protein